MNEPTPDELKRLAEAAGRTVYRRLTKKTYVTRKDEYLGRENWRPDIDRNQCDEVEQALTDDQKKVYGMKISVNIAGFFDLATVSPEIRCRALLEVIE